MLRNRQLCVTCSMCTLWTVQHVRFTGAMLLCRSPYSTQHMRKFGIFRTITAKLSPNVLPSGAYLRNWSSGHSSLTTRRISIAGGRHLLQKWTKKVLVRLVKNAFPAHNSAKKWNKRKLKCWSTCRNAQHRSECRDTHKYQPENFPKIPIIVLSVERRCNRVAKESRHNSPVQLRIIISRWQNTVFSGVQLFKPWILCI
jgi:hypothetical protein